MELLSGYVTMGAAVGLVILGLIKIWKNDTQNGLIIITAGIGLFGARRAIGNTQAEITKKLEEIKPCNGE